MCKANNTQSHFILTTTLKCRYNQYLHFTEESLRPREVKPTACGHTADPGLCDPKPWLIVYNPQALTSYHHCSRLIGRLRWSPLTSHMGLSPKAQHAMKDSRLRISSLGSAGLSPALIGWEASSTVNALHLAGDSTESQGKLQMGKSFEKSYQKEVKHCKDSKGWCMSHAYTLGTSEPGTISWPVAHSLQ